MAGVRKLASGTVQGWYRDERGRRKYFTLKDATKTEVREMAQALEADAKRVQKGYKPASAPHEKHAARPIGEVVAEYVAWGAAQGGRGGRPWSRSHRSTQPKRLARWVKRLALTKLSDLDDDTLPRVEKAIQELQVAGKAPKTIRNYVEALQSFCNWCADRRYLPKNPLKAMAALPVTPQSVRRLLSYEEIARLLSVAPESRQLLYMLACCSGLRVSELRALSVDDLDTEHCGLVLHEEWTKNRKPGFQRLPASLVRRLQAYVAAGVAERLYAKAERHCPRKHKAPNEPLIYVPGHPTREMDRDLEAAGIAKSNPSGKVDFHALRLCFINFIMEAGASTTEAMAMARHSSPALTLGVYGRTRRDRLDELAEKVGRVVIPGELCAHSVRGMAAGAEGLDVTALQGEVLQQGRASAGRGPGSLTQPHYRSEALYQNGRRASTHSAFVNRNCR